MTGVHLHLILNHVPIIGMIFSVIVLILALKFKSDPIRRVGLFLILVTGAVTVGAFLTGEPAEKMIEDRPGISELAIAAHEDAAERTAWAIWITSATALGALYLDRRNKRNPIWVLPSILFLSLICIGLAAWSNNLGGKIVHHELSESLPASE